MPVNWYAALVVIVLVGIASVFLARHDYTRQVPKVEPFVGETWHAALAVDICGKTQPALTASPSTTTTGLTTTGKGALLIAPKNSSESGTKATLGKFAAGYTGFTLTNTSLQYPGGTLYKNGQTCAKGTPDAGEVGHVQVRSWTLPIAKSGGEDKLQGGHTSTQAADLRFQNRQLITVGFIPARKTLPRPPSSAEVALVQALAGTGPVVTTTTTTAPAATTTTTAGSGTTTTTAASGTTTTTKPPSTTTTTKPAG
jgi:hypothetical protein